MKMLSRETSGLRHLRWAREVLATLEAHVADNPRLTEPERAAASAEAERLRALVDALSGAVKPYRDFLERRRVKARGAVRVGHYLVSASPEPGSTDVLHRAQAALASLEVGERRPLKAALSAAIDALREGLTQMNRALASRTSKALVDSLYPPLTADESCVVDDPDPDDDATDV